MQASISNFSRKSRQKAFYWVPFTLAALYRVLCAAHCTALTLPLACGPFREKAGEKLFTGYHSLWPLFTGCRLSLTVPRLLHLWSADRFGKRQVKSFLLGTIHSGRSLRVLRVVHYAALTLPLACGPVREKAGEKLFTGYHSLWPLFTGCYVPLTVPGLRCLWPAARFVFWSGRAFGK